MDDDWENGAEATIVGSRNLVAQLRQSVSNSLERAYVIVIAGPNLGQMFKLEGQATIGRDASAEVRLNDTEVSRAHATIVVEDGAVRIQDRQSTNGTFVNGEPVINRVLADGDKIQIGTTTILKFSYHDDFDAEFQKKMYTAALRDGLTGAFNKRHLVERLESEMAFATRHRSPLSFVLFDLDHFKKINDTYGHLAGDYVLSTLAAGILKTVRTEDVFARYGGEEFAMLSRGLTMEDGARFGERLRTWVESYPFSYEGTSIPVTISCGVSGIPECDVTRPEDLISLADQALYESKRNGRNRVTIVKR